MERRGEEERPKKKQTGLWLAAGAAVVGLAVLGNQDENAPEQSPPAYDYAQPAPETELPLTLDQDQPQSAPEAAPEVIIDSAMTLEQALAGKEMPEAIREAQRLVNVEYIGLDGREHRGQLVVHQEVAEDVSAIFADIKTAKFPIKAVVPVVKYGWDDNASMEANNTSGFNYRTMTGSSRLSEHAHGRAVDINPFLNPYISGGDIDPDGASYKLQAPGTIGPDSPVVKAFKERGWEWGGDWDDPKDYQHFEKPAE